MPITSVRAPDGAVIKVEHPESATSAEIIAYAQKNPPVTSSARQPEPSLMAAIESGNVPAIAERFPILTGVGKGLDEMGRNLKARVAEARFSRLVGGNQPIDVTPTTPAETALWEQFKARHPYTAEGGRMTARMAPAAVAPASIACRKAARVFSGRAALAPR